jgi:hypothetical protein
MKIKRQNVFRVPNVRVGDSVMAVRFKLLPKQQAVKCATKGETPFTVLRDGNRFVCRQRGNDLSASGPNPAQAFAQGVKTFWNMWG